MADSREDNKPSGDAAQQPEGSPPAPGFRIGNVLKVVVPLVLVGVGGVVFVGYFDGLNLLKRMTAPALVPATGQIIYQGKPLDGAVITTRHTDGKMRGATGWTDAEGRFTLQTDFNGYVDGAFAGEHQVMITAYQVISAAAAPPLITPEIYAKSETTPLRITISTVAAENDFVLTLEGSPPERPVANFGGGGQGPPGGGRGFDPEAIVRRVFEEFDKDGDDQLSGEELEALEGDRAERIRQADANDDGVVGRDEVLQAFSRRQRPESE